MSLPTAMSPARVPRTLILSDLHLGRPDGAGRADAFETLLADFDRVIVNGDVAELHHAEYRADAEFELARFRDICSTRGTKLDLIAGNHDPFVSDVRSVSIANGAIYVTHGDAFHPAVAPWSPHAAVMRRAFEAAIAAAPRDLAADAVRFAAARDAAIAEWRTMGDGAHVSTVRSMLAHPTRVLAVLRYWTSYPSLAAEWASRHAPEAGTVVVGHSHRAFHRSVGGRNVVNTGSYGFPGRPHAVVIEGTTVRLHAVIKRGHFFALAGDAKAAWPIAFHAEGLARTAQTDAYVPAASTPAMNRAASASAARSSDVR
jgi:predicted phosphodiesterase